MFAGQKPLSRVEKNERLQNWFTSISGQIDALDFNDRTVAGRRIQQLMRGTICRPEPGGSQAELS